MTAPWSHPPVIREGKNCEGNARWDRIFREKFEDPTYYDRGRTSHQAQSCLGAEVRTSGRSEATPIPRAEDPADVGPAGPVTNSAWRRNAFDIGKNRPRRRL